MNEELTIAIEELRQRPVERACFIPVLLNAGSSSDRDIGAGETLRHLQAVDLSAGPNSPEWRQGIRDLAQTIMSTVDQGIGHGVLESLRLGLAR